MPFRFVLITIFILMLSALPSLTGAQQATPPSDETLLQGAPQAIFETGEKQFTGSMAENGSWSATANLKIITMPQGQDLSAKGSFEIRSKGLAYHTKQKVIKGIFVLLIGERVFDEKGFYSYGRNVFASGFLTDTGFPVEGITHGLPTDFFGGNIKHPINRIITVSPDAIAVNIEEGRLNGKFAFDFAIDPLTPSGTYRFSLLMGVQLDDTHYVTLMNEDPNSEEMLGDSGSVLHLGMASIGNPAAAHLSWVILPEYIPGGVMARTDSKEFAVTTRTGFTPRAIIPLINPNGGQISYRLEPSMPYLTDTSKSPLSLDLQSGEISIKIKTPSGHLIDLGSTMIIGWDGSYLSTGENRFNFAFSEYGHHEIEVTGFIKDKSGITIGGGGIYDVYIARKLDIITNIPAGVPLYPKENLDLALRIVPPVAADVKVEKILNPWSQKGKIEQNSFEMKCNRWGVYTPRAEEIKKRWTLPDFIRFSRPGEYRVDIYAEYKDPQGVLYMGARTLAGVVLDEKNIINITGGASSPADTLTPPGNAIFFPEKNGEILAIPSGTDLVFDPDLRIILTNQLRDSRILAGEKTYDLPDGSTGFFPRSTAEGLAAHWYPEKIDRRMYSYILMSAPDGRTMFAVKDGGSLLGEIEPPAGIIKTLDGDFFNLFGTMILRDYPLDKMYYGTLLCGAVSSKSVTSTGITSSAEASNLLNRKVPFMHLYSFFPGAIVEKDRPFVPRCMVFPPSKGVVKIALTQPNGEKTFVNGLVDDRGLLNKFLEETPILWQEGVHVVHYSLFAGISNTSEIKGDVTASDETEFPFYVVLNNKDNNFAWSIPVGTSVDYSKPFAINAFLGNTNLLEAKAFYTLSFNGELIETGEAQFKDNTFEVSINLPRIIEKVTNLDPKDPLDVIEMGCMVKGVNEKGKNRFLASRITIRSGRIEY